jgi:RIO kinase 2
LYSVTRFIAPFGADAGRFSVSGEYGPLMVENVASVIRELEPEDFYLLSGVEQGMRFSEYVNREKLPEFSGLTAENVDYRLDRCEDRGLIERKTIQYQGFSLTFEGYDALALHTFVERDTIDGVGAPLGVGKESDVYEVRSYEPMALKFHREGYTEFREVMKEREYTADRDHVSWQYTARKAAEREYDALETLYPDVSVPRPVDQNRHAIVMEKIDGVELARTKLTDAQVIPVLELVLDEVTTAYAAGWVHADMSEYNVFVTEAGVVVFDWPQAVATDHENAREFLERDVENIAGYFGRKYPSHVGDPDAPALADAVASDDLDDVTQFLDRARLS